MNSNNNNTALIVFAVIAAFGLVMATVAVLPIVPQAHAGKGGLQGPNCNKEPGPGSPGNAKLCR
jgi:hypothetical protein